MLRYFAINRAWQGSGGVIHIGAEEVREGIGGKQCGYEETGAMPVVVIVEEKEKALKIGYMTIHAKLFGASRK
jgi:hypothetical protein